MPRLANPATPENHNQTAHQGRLVERLDLFPAIGKRKNHSMIMPFMHYAYQAYYIYYGELSAARLPGAIRPLFIIQFRRTPDREAQHGVAPHAKSGSFADKNPLARLEALEHGVESTDFRAELHGHGDGFSFFLAVDLGAVFGKAHGLRGHHRTFGENLGLDFDDSLGLADKEVVFVVEDRLDFEEAGLGVGGWALKKHLGLCQLAAGGQEAEGDFFARPEKTEIQLRDIHENAELVDIRHNADELVFLHGIPASNIQQAQDSTDRRSNGMPGQNLARVVESAAAFPHFSQRGLEGSVADGA